MKTNRKLRRFNISHSKKIENNVSGVEFFQDSDHNSASVSNTSEKEIVKWLFYNSTNLNIIVEELSGLSVRDIEFKLEVKEPLLNSEDQEIIGDIDAVIIPKKQINNTVIIEFKRIKLRTLYDKTTKVNKIKTCKNKGFKQISKLCKFKFFKTYLGVIIEDDSRYVESANTAIRNSKIDLETSIHDINFDNALNANAGLFFIKITQPTGEKYESRFNFSFFIEKEATALIQNSVITDRVNQLINN